MAEYTIFRPDADDEDAMQVTANLHRICFPGAYVYPWDGTHWWLVHQGLETGVIAFAGLKASTKENGGYLCRSGVLYDHRGHGLQRRLIKARVRFASYLGLDYVVSDTIDNPVSANHLADEGFRMFDPITPWGREGALYWRKDL